MKLLLVEDDPSVARSLFKALRRADYDVVPVALGGDALRAIEAITPDMVVLDLGLPDMDGMAVLAYIRRSTQRLPVLVLTARDATPDKVNALDLGADDYLPKPFEIEELLARLRVISRRIDVTDGGRLQIGPVTLDPSTQRFLVEDEALSLSRREFRLLRALMESAGRVQTRTSLEETLYQADAEVASNALEVHVSNLRKKLPPGFIRTVRGVGYTIDSRS